MFSIIFDKFFVLFCLFLVSFVVASDDFKQNNVGRGSRSDKGALWFGPRLGKRSSGPEVENDRASIINLLKAAEAVKYYFDQMQTYESPDDEQLTAYVKAKKKIIFTPRPGRAANDQKKVIFRPILGRSVDEDKGYESVDFTPRLGRRVSNDMPATPPDYDKSEQEMDSRSKYSPRLGRNMKFSPRLGRDMTFSPRLGRDMTFSPRLGREIDFGLLLSVMASPSTCHVLVAGNEEAFRSLAKNFVPQKLADQLANLVSQASEATILEEDDNAPMNVQNKEYINQNDYAVDVDKEREYEAPDEQLQFRIHPQPTSLIRQATEARNPKKMEVNLDELVEKVRARLLDELKTSSPGPLNDNSPRSQQNQRPPDQDYKDPGNADYAAPQNNPQPHTNKRPPDQDYNDGNTNDPTPQKPRINKRPRRVSLKLPMKPTKKDKPGVVIEAHDLYNKVKLSKHKNNQKDSYEDYISKVKKNTRDIFESEEDLNSPKRNQNESPITKRPERTSFRPKSTTRNNEFNNKNYNDDNNDYQNNNNNNNMNRKLTRRTRSTQRTEMFSKKDFDYNDRGPRNKQRTSDRPVRTSKADYVDDDIQTESSTADTEPKAVTEFMGGWDDETPVGFQTPTEEVVMYPRKKTPKKIVTNMQIRQRYSMNTPNYYEKLPRIAEKYNFDEPIPEKDREEETMKPMFQEPKNINGKVKV